MKYRGNICPNELTGHQHCLEAKACVTFVQYLESRMALRREWLVVRHRRVELTAKCYLAVPASIRSGNERWAPVAVSRTDTCSGKLLSQPITACAVQ